MVTRGFTATRVRSQAELRSLVLGLRGREPEAYHVLAGMKPLLRAVVCTGDDPLLALHLGDLVYYVYGSPWRLACRRCGYRARVTPEALVKGVLHCPRCGAELEPSTGDTVDQRVLGEALTELLSSEVVVAVSMPEPSYLEALLALLPVRTGARLLCDPTVPEWLPCSERYGGTVEALRAASAHGR